MHVARLQRFQALRSVSWESVRCSREPDRFPVDRLQQIEPGPGREVVISEAIFAAAGKTPAES
jgi:hypothetical protein